jgi:ubiquinone/menaquinone biosynthesis C-methylase UbiE
MDNSVWSEEILKRIDPSFRHRWVVYYDLLDQLLTPDTTWIDCGCGDNGIVSEYGARAKEATGVDMIDHDASVKNYIKADIKRLPFPSGYADLVTLRFVVEHFESSEPYLDEIYRVLKPGGRLVILTTNALSPLIFIPRIILPYPLKNFILSTVFKVSETDIFPTYHKLNTAKKINAFSDKFTVEKLDYISDMNYQRKPVFLALMAFHLVTAPVSLRKFRTNILAILQKK